MHVYTSCGGTISADGTSLTGGIDYNYINGASVNFTASPIDGFNFLCWEYASASGPNISTDNPFVYTISSTESEIQAMFIPTVNASLSFGTTQTVTSPFDVLTSIGGTTFPAAGTYTNYTIGSVVTFVADAANNFKLLYWLVPAASGGSTIITSNSFAFDVTANACALQAYFIPTSSSLTLLTARSSTSTPKVIEFSSAAVIIMVTALVIASFGTYWIRKTSRK